MFFAATCPPGWVESNVTKGYALVGRPSGSTSGTKLNDPMGAGEKSRVGPHTHLAAVTDPGHTHVATVSDQGHIHGATVSDPEHTHVATVSDQGHVHGATVTDPGHTHTSPIVRVL